MNLLFDLKYAWRLLIKSWGYSLMCASVVALSVGLAVWTAVLGYSQIFKPLGFPGSQRWYSVQMAPEAKGRARPSVDAYTWQEMMKHNRSADHLGAFSDDALVLSEGQATTSLRGTAVSHRVLSETRVAPVLGRLFNATDGMPGAAPVAIISFDTWQNYFAGDPKIIGKTARIDAAPVQIVGILPRDYLIFDDYEVWVPLQLPTLARPQDSTMTVSPLILLREGQSLAPIVNELKTAVDDVNRGYPKLFNAGRHVELVPAARMYNHGMTPILAMLGLVSAGVLLLGCVNISMVFFARLLERSRELALRNALGASRGRLLRQCLLETALIVLIGLAAGYGLAFLGVRWTHGISNFMSEVMASGRSTNLPTMRPVDLVFAVIAAIAVWLLSTLIPAWRIARQDAAVVLAGSGKGAAVRGSNKSVGLLVGLQVFISCVVLLTCGNVVVAVDKEGNKPSGIVTEDVMISTFATQFDQKTTDATRRLRYWEDLTAAIAKKVPGAELAITTAPPSRPVPVPASIETRQGGENQGALTLPVTVVSESYFTLLGIKLRAGRLFDSTDNSDSLKVAIVDEKMAARYWPDENVVGKRVRLNSTDDNSWLTIVGVVSTVPGGVYRPDAEVGSMYQPLRQAIPTAFHVLVKVPHGAADPRTALRAAAFSIDRDLPLHNLQKLDDFMRAIKLGTTAMIPLFIVVSLITAFLAATGLFGLISRSVAQRTQEVGIRRALGATTWRASSIFLRKGALYLAVAIAGGIVGILVMPPLSRAIPNILDHVLPVTAAVVLLMASVISTASYLPTRRAVALEPGDALRYE